MKSYALYQYGMSRYWVLSLILSFSFSSTAANAASVQISLLAPIQIFEISPFVTGSFSAGGETYSYEFNQSDLRNLRTIKTVEIAGGAITQCSFQWEWAFPTTPFVADKGLSHFQSGTCTLNSDGSIVIAFPLYYETFEVSVKNGQSSPYRSAAVIVNYDEIINPNGTSVPKFLFRMQPGQTYFKKIGVLLQAPPVARGIKIYRGINGLDSKPYQDFMSNDSRLEFSFDH